MVWARTSAKNAAALGVKPVATFFSMSASTESWSCAVSLAKGALLRLRVHICCGEVGGIAGARAAQRAGERAVDVMRRTRLGGARPVLVAGDEPRDDRLERIGLGGGERLQRFEPGCGERHRGLCGL